MARRHRQAIHDEHGVVIAALCTSKPLSDEVKTALRHLAEAAQRHFATEASKGPDMPNAIHRYEIPVDDAWHTLRLTGTIVHIAARQANNVEIWAHTNGISQWRTFRAYGTGQPIPGEDAHTRPVHIGSALTQPDGNFVWHLFELTSLEGHAYPGQQLDGGTKEIAPAAGHGYTYHGHACCDLAVGEPSLVARCGGPGLCGNCSQSVARFHGAREAGQQ